MLKEISFDYNGHRYAVRCYDGQLPLYYQKDYKACTVVDFIEAIKGSNRDTSNYRRMLGLPTKRVV